MGLATYGEIYKIFIPLLSHFKRLPNEAVSDWCNEILIEREVCLSWAATFQGYIRLLDKVRDREAQDRFSDRAAAMFVEFLLRVKENPDHFAQKYLKRELSNFNKDLRERFENQNLLRMILSLESLLTRRWYPGEDDRTGSILKKLGFNDIIGKKNLQRFPLGELRSSDNLSWDERFSFPNGTDVFGWTREYWSIFENEDLVPASRFSECSTLDLAGRSVLHHKIDCRRYRDEDMAADFLFADRNYLGDSSIFIARCNKQTPLHRAAMAGHEGLINELLAQGIDPNAGDHYGRTALCLAVFHGYAEVVCTLDHSMSSDGRDRKDNDSRNALHYAIFGGKENLAISLINRGININCEDKFRRQPLWWAAWYKRNRVLVRLLEKSEIQMLLMIWRPPGEKYNSREIACQTKILDWDSSIRGQATRQDRKISIDPETGAITAFALSIQ